VPQRADEVIKPCCGPAVNPRIEAPDKSYDPAQPQFRIPRKVVKGGSYLCAPNYCLRYRPAPGADDRHRHESHRHTLHRAEGKERLSVRGE
jgi:hypothetical protein